MREEGEGYPEQPAASGPPVRLARGDHLPPQDGYNPYWQTLSPLLSSLRFLQRQPDARLMAFALGAHKGRFEVLVQRYRRPLLAYCRRLAPEASAEDILQQALLQAWTALGAGLEVRDPRAWLYRIVHNVAISTVRRTSGAAAEPTRGVSALGADDEL